LDDRHSTAGYTFTISGSSVTWSSKKQQTVAPSSTEAEYMALTQATKEAIWIKCLLTELNINDFNQQLITIMTDSQGSQALAKNVVYHSRTKHIDIQHHFVREKVDNEDVKIVYCPTEEMIADVLTKGLSKEKHNRFIEGMSLVEMEDIKKNDE